MAEVAAAASAATAQPPTVPVAGGALYDYWPAPLRPVRWWEAGGGGGGGGGDSSADVKGLTYEAFAVPAMSGATYSFRLGAAPTAASEKETDAGDEGMYDSEWRPAPVTDEARRAEILKQRKEAAEKRAASKEAQKRALAKDPLGREVRLSKARAERRAQDKPKLARAGQTFLDRFKTAKK